MSRRKGGAPPKRILPNNADALTLPAFDPEKLKMEWDNVEERFKNVPGTYPRFDQLLQKINAAYLWGSSKVIPVLEELFGERQISTPGPLDENWFKEEIAGWRLYYRSDLDNLRYEYVVKMINVAALLINNGLQVKRSENPSAGNGLFTTRPFEKGAPLTFYGGYLSTVDALECLGLDDVYRQYVLAIPGDGTAILDAQICFRLGYEMGRWPNSIQGTGKMTNARFKFGTHQDGTPFAYIESVRELQAGEEILLDYGDKFWLIAECMQCKSKMTAIMCGLCGTSLCGQICMENHVGKKKCQK